MYVFSLEVGIFVVLFVQGYKLKKINFGCFSFVEEKLLFFVVSVFFKVVNKKCCYVSFNEVIFWGEIN